MHQGASSGTPSKAEEISGASIVNLQSIRGFMGLLQSHVESHVQRECRRRDLGPGRDSRFARFDLRCRLEEKVILGIVDYDTCILLILSARSFRTVETVYCRLQGTPNAQVRGPFLEGFTSRNTSTYCSSHSKT
jgi:hypothetical protein